MPPRLSGAPVVTKRAKPVSRVATGEALCVRAAALCRGLSTPRMPLRRGPLGLSGGERAGPQTYLSARFVRSTSVPPVLVQVFREAGARAGADAQQACGGKACGSQQGREEAAGAFGPPTAARQGGGRRRPGCRESRAVAGLQRGSPGRWGSLSQSHMLEESAFLQDPRSAQSLSGSSRGKVWLWTSAAAGPSGRESRGS